MQPASRIVIPVLLTLAVATVARAQTPGPPSRPGSVVIAGQLKTVDGMPAADVRVSALVAPPEAVRPEEGIRAQDGIQYYLAPPPVRTVLTDKDGRYRITNLPPGRYLVAAGLPGQDTYYPDAVDAHGAKVLPLAADSTGSADFALLAPLAGRISGRVVPPPDPNVQENAILSGVFLTELVETPVRADGTFEFGRVPEGTYLVDLFPTVPGLKSVLFDVERNDVNNLQLIRPKLYTVSGRFNVARGRHIVTDDLVAALQAGTIGGAALDVTDPEPLPEGHPLWSLPNCIITPHVGNTPEMAGPLLAERITTNVRRFAEGEELLGPVDVELGY